MTNNESGSTREYRDSESFQVATSIGLVRVVLNDASNVYVTTDLRKGYGERNEPGLTVNRVVYRASIHLQLTAAGWAPSSPSSLYAYRMNSTIEGITASARKKMIDILTKEIGAWLSINTVNLQRAEGIKRNNEALSLEGKIAELEAELIEKRAELAKILKVETK